MKLQQWSSVFLQYKDVVHVMPTKCLKTENLFDIVKLILFVFEEIDFKVLWIITDNNTINENSFLFLLQSYKAFHCIFTPIYKVFSS